MKFNDCVDNVSTFIDLKRFANEYVIDYKRLSIDELKAAVKKTSPQYSNIENVRKTIDFFELHQSRNYRILFDIMIKKILLNSDDFTEEQGTVEDKVLSYEQEIVDLANEYVLDNEIKDVDFYKYVVEAAWENNNEISVDEQNLINKIKARLRITDKHHQILEAQIGRFPQEGNVLHSRDDVSEVRRLLQSKGIIMSFRDSNNVDYDVIPEEIAVSLRELFGVDIRESSFYKLLDSKYVKNKKYLIDIYQRSGYSVQPGIVLSELKEQIVERLTAHKVINGLSSKDGLDNQTLSEWCSSLGLSPYGTKPEMTNRIISYYDEIKQIKNVEEDERELYYQYYTDLASRNLSLLHQQGVISKDLECEHKFETATNYIFEKIFNIKPLIMSGTEHPDGMLSFNDKLVMWDNKSKEMDVSLAEHIKQFDRYIKSSPKPVSIFIVIGPSFTQDSAKECAKYALSNDTIIVLITAEELKLLAEKYISQRKNETDPLPLGVFKQNGRFDLDLVSL